MTDIAQVWQSETQIVIIYATKSSRSNKSADRSKDSSAIFRHYINPRIRSVTPHNGSRIRSDEFLRSGMVNQTSN